MIADTDAEHLETLTKKDMMDFYAQYISPASPLRSKLSVHLQAQSKPKEPTLEEKKASAVSALQVILTQHQIDCKPEDLQTKINEASSADVIPVTVQKYLSGVLALNEDVAAKILDEAKAALGVADSGLPAEPEVLIENVNVDKVVDAKHPVLIKDVHAWKASMQLSVGVRPIKPLEEYVEVAEKL